jgi:ATP-binding protein involved in chromosome partitioning
MTSNQKILDALRHVIDPDLKKDIVSLNMVSDLTVDGKKVKFTFTLTTPACPLKDFLKKSCVEAIHQHVDKDMEVEIVMGSKVTSVRKEADEMLKGVRNIIAVASGKGGVGKSTVAVNLAVALAKSGARVGLIDADIYGPSIPLMFGMVDGKPFSTEENGKVTIIPMEKYGIKLLSIGFFVDQSKALIWRGPMASMAIKQLFTDADWGELDYMVLDLPPGTGDIPLTLVQSFPLTGAVIVSTPQQVAIADVRKAADMFNNEQIRIPILGVVENMSYFSPPELPEKKYHIFGLNGGRQFAEELKVPLLGQLPILMAITESGDAGCPVASGDNTPEAKAFTELAKKVAQQVAIHNAIKETFSRS